jgi:hypothetical protein
LNQQPVIAGEAHAGQHVGRIGAPDDQTGPPYAPLDYVQTPRIEEAKQLLETTGEPTDAVAHQVGYDGFRLLSPPFQTTNRRNTRAVQTAVSIGREIAARFPTLSAGERAVVCSRNRFAADAVELVC